jgi:hypothetical protein
MDDVGGNFNDVLSFTVLLGHVGTNVARYRE